MSQPMDPQTANGEQSLSNHLLQEIRDGIKDLLKSNATSSEVTDELFWSAYMNEAKTYDDELVKKYRNDMEGVVFFSTLFSAVVAVFIVAIQPALGPNPSDTTNALLKILIHTIDNSTFPNQPLEIPQWYGPSHEVLWCLTLSYLSLSLSLFAALGAVMGKQWLSHLDYHGEGTTEERGRCRQQKRDNLDDWGFHTAMKILPALLHVALVLFGIALSFSLLGINQTIAKVLISVTAGGGLVYLVLTGLSTVFHSCPYKTPLSAFIRWMFATVIDATQGLTYWLQAEAPESTAHPLAALLLLLLFPIFGWAAILLILIVTIVDQRGGFINETLSHLKAWLPSAPQRTSELRPFIWILQTSNHLDVTREAMERIYDAARGTHFWDSWGREDQQTNPGPSLLDTKRLCDLFILSVKAVNKQSSENREYRATTLGKALVTVLSYWKFHGAPRLRIWGELSLRFWRLLTALNTKQCDISYLLYLLISLLPHEDKYANPLEQGLVRIPAQLFIWSLPLLHHALQYPQRKECFPIVRATLAYFSFSEFESGKWFSASEQRSYFLIVYTCLEYSAQHNIAGLHRVMVQILKNILYTVETDRVTDGYVLETLYMLSALLQDPALPWPYYVQISVHQLAYRTYLGATMDHPTQNPVSHLMDAVLELAAADPSNLDSNPRDYIYSDFSRIRPLLLRHLSSSIPTNTPYHTPKVNRLVYLLKLFASSSAQDCGSVLADDSGVFDRLIALHNPSDRLQRYILDILSVSYELATYRDQIHNLLLRPNFFDYALNVIKSQDPAVRTAGLRFFSTTLPYLSSEGWFRERWEADPGLQHAVRDLRAEEATLPYADSLRIYLTQIWCVLYPLDRGDELATYWEQWRGEEDEFNVARVLPAAYWVLINCKGHGQQGWYRTIQDHFEDRLRVAWRGDLEEDPTPLLGLMTCTRHYYSNAPRDDVTSGVLRDALSRLREMLQRYNFTKAFTDAVSDFEQWFQPTR